LKEQRKTGRKADPDKQLKIAFAKSIQGTGQEITDAVNKQFNSEHDRRTIERWLEKFDADHTKENSNAETK
jgi:hypothetical protein